MSPLVHAELYKYVNEDGVTVLDSHVLARYVKNGYTILSLNGRVPEVVPGALTTSEIRVRDLRLEEEAKVERRRRAQQLADNNLLLYSTPADVMRARDTKLASIDNLISTHRGNLIRLQGQQRNLEADAADIERAGGTLSKERLGRLRTIDNRIKQIMGEIKEKQDEKRELEVSFSADLKRVRELFEGPPAR